MVNNSLNNSFDFIIFMPIQDYCKYALVHWYSKDAVECKDPNFCEYEIRYGNSKYCRIALNQVKENSIEHLLEIRR